jgi:hypothetical protein
MRQREIDVIGLHVRADNAPADRAAFRAALVPPGSAGR